MRKGPGSPSKAATLGRDSLSSQLSKFEDKKRKHVQTLERKTSNMKQMFKKGKGECSAGWLDILVVSVDWSLQGDLPPPSTPHIWHSDFAAFAPFCRLCRGFVHICCH